MHKHIQSSQEAHYTHAQRHIGQGAHSGPCCYNRAGLGDTVVDTMSIPMSIPMSRWLLWQSGTDPAQTTQGVLRLSSPAQSTTTSTSQCFHPSLLQSANREEREAIHRYHYHSCSNVDSPKLTFLSAKRGNQDSSCSGTKPKERRI